MIILNKVYEFKAEFAKLLSIPANQVDRRQQELLDWLTNFFDYEFYEGRPKRILIKEIYGEYQPLPRKAPKQDELNQKKKEDYTKYTIASLGTEFKPNSKSKIARDAINDFGLEKYNHTNSKAVARRFVKEPFDKYGESNGKRYWVWYSTYKKISKEIFEEWMKILKEEHISEEEAACAFYRQEQGEDISKEKEYYKRAVKRLKDKYHDIPVQVSEWKLKSMEIEE